MKKYLFLFLFSNLLLAQNNPQLQWAKVQPNSEVGGIVSAVSATKDSAGNIYFIGNFNNTVDFDPSSNTSKLTSIGDSDLFISKYNSDGDFIWAKNIGGMGTITPRNVEINGTSLYIVGSFAGLIDFDPSSNIANQLSNGESDFFIVKYDLDGAYNLITTIGGTASDEAYDIKFFNDEIIIVGSFIGTVDFDPSNSTFELISSGLFSDMFISKYSPNLEFLSAFKIGGTNSDTATSLAIDSTGDLFVTGLFRDIVDFDTSTNVVSLTSTSTDASNAFILKCSNNGNFIWVKDIGARSTLNALNKITLDSSNAILVCGGFTLASDFDPSATTFTLTPSFTNTNDAFVAKYNSVGNFIWAKRFGSVQGNDKCFSIVTDNSNNVYIGGENKFSSQSNGFITKYNASGSVQFTFNIGSSAAKIALESITNSFYVFGNFINNSDFNPSTTTTNYLFAEIDNGFLAKYTLDGNYIFSKKIGDISSNNSFNLVSTDANGNVYRAGNLGGSLDLDPSSNNTTVSSIGWTDFYISKYSSNGDYIWGKIIEGLDFNGVNLMNTDADGNTYIVGRFFGTVDFDPSANVANLTSTSTSIARDSYIAKYDTNGNFLWVKKIENTNPLDTIQFDSEGNFYFMGRFSGTVDFNPSPSTYYLTALTAGNADIFFVKFNPQGDLIWAKSLGSDNINSPYKIYLRNNNLYITGIFVGSIDFDPSISQTVSISSNNVSGFLSKYDLDGNYNLAFKIEDSTQLNNVWGYSVVEDSDNNFYFFTQYKGTVDFDPSPTESSINTANFYEIGISKYTQTGGHLWSKFITGSNTNNWASFIGFQTFIDANDIIIVCGSYGGSYDFDTSLNENILTTSFDSTTNQYKDNLFIAKYNVNGDLISAHKLNGYYNSRLTSAVYFNNQELLLCGSFNGTIDFDLTTTSQMVSSSSTNYDDRFFAKYYNDTLDAPEYDNQANFIIYPNPASNVLNIHNPFLSNVAVTVTDITGKVLYISSVNNDVELNVINYTTGLYFISIENKENNKIETYKFFKK